MTIITILGIICGLLAGVSAMFFVALKKTSSELENANNEIHDKTSHMNGVETQLQLRKQEISMLKQSMADWEKTKEQHLEAAKSSMLKASAEMSNKLLDDHKREAKSMKEDSEKRIHETTKELHKNFETVSRYVKSLDDQFKDVKESSEVVKRALLNPTGSGNLGEITLANIFKASNLIENQDYHLQYSIRTENGDLLKPDAVVFLPGNSVMVIDSKVSKFFVEISELSNSAPAQTKEIEAKLKTSMNSALKSLTVKDYALAFEQQLKKNDPKSELGAVNMLMFLPSETALETLRRIDQTFMDKAWQQHIIPVGPSGMMNALIQSRMQIINSQQEANSTHIIEEVKNLLGSVAKLHETADKIGNSVKNSLKRYDDFAKSFNGNFLPKTNKIRKLGVETAKGNIMPKLERYHIITEDMDGESVDLDEQIAIEAPENKIHKIDAA